MSARPDETESIDLDSYRVLLRKYRALYSHESDKVAVEAFTDGPDFAAGGLYFDTEDTENVSIPDDRMLKVMRMRVEENERHMAREYVRRAK